MWIEDISKQFIWLEVKEVDNQQIVLGLFKL